MSKIILKKAEERIDGAVWKYHDKGFGKINYLTIKLDEEENWTAKLTKADGEILEWSGDLLSIVEGLEEVGIEIENIEELSNKAVMVDAHRRFGLEESEEI